MEQVERFAAEVMAPLLALIAVASRREAAPVGGGREEREPHRDRRDHAERGRRARMPSRSDGPQSRRASAVAWPTSRTPRATADAPEPHAVHDRGLDESDARAPPHLCVEQDALAGAPREDRAADARRRPSIAISPHRARASRVAKRRRVTAATTISDVAIAATGAIGQRAAGR